MFLDVHHDERRAVGAAHDPDKLCALCTEKDGHHPLTHRGQRVIRGTVLDVPVDVGFEQREGQEMIDRATPHVGQ